MVENIIFISIERVLSRNYIYCDDKRLVVKDDEPSDAAKPRPRRPRKRNVSVVAAAQNIDGTLRLLKEKHINFLPEKKYLLSSPFLILA